MVLPRSHRGDQRRVHAHWAELGSATRATERGVAAWQYFCEKRGGVGEMLLLVLGQIGFVLDRADLANQLASAAIHALVG